MGRGIKTRTRFDNGRVLEYRNRYYWIPKELDDEHLRQGDKLEPRDIKREVDLIEFGSQEQAECWGRIQQLGPSYESQPVEFPSVEERQNRHGDKDRCIPVTVAKEGKAKIAAYLYATDQSTLGISHDLDVSERTVDQYISDVRRGER